MRWSLPSVWGFTHLSPAFDAICGLSKDGVVGSEIANSYDCPMILFDDAEDFNAFIHYVYQIT